MKLKHLICPWQVEMHTIYTALQEPYSSLWTKRNWNTLAWGSAKDWILWALRLGTMEHTETELAWLHQVPCGHMLCSSHPPCLTRMFHWKNISILVLLGHDFWGDFAERLGDGYISGIRSHKCHQPSFMTTHLGIASSQVKASLISRWKIWLYSPLQFGF